MKGKHSTARWLSALLVIALTVTLWALPLGSAADASATLDETLFRKGYDILNASTLDLTEFSTTKVAGEILCNRDGLMYTSIPDDGNWKAYVDGKEAEIVLVGDAMIGLNLTKGYHSIVFVYRNSAFTYGVMLTMVSVLAFLALIYWTDREKWNERALKVYRFIKKK